MSQVLAVTLTGAHMATIYICIKSLVSSTGLYWSLCCAFERDWRYYLYEFHVLEYNTCGVDAIFKVHSQLN